MRFFRQLILMVLVAAVTFPEVIVSPAIAGTKISRQKVIDFDDELVEGMNKRPLDSLSQISERNKKRRKPHLYRKRTGFRAETAETLREMRYTQ